MNTYFCLTLPLQFCRDSVITPTSSITYNTNGILLIIIWSQMWLCCHSCNKKRNVCHTPLKHETVLLSIHHQYFLKIIRLFFVCTYNASSFRHEKNHTKRFYLCRDCLLIISSKHLNIKTHKMYMPAKYTVGVNKNNEYKWPTHYNSVFH